MGEIKVGDYIRTNRGHIGRLKRIELDQYDTFLKWYIYDEKLFEINIVKETYINKPYIVKHSPNIIDLLEVKDVIKYQELRSLTNKYGTSFYEYYICDIHTEEELEQIKSEIKSHKIKLISVLTKELFKNSEYEV